MLRSALLLVARITLETRLLWVESTMRIELSDAFVYLKLQTFRSSSNIDGYLSHISQLLKFSMHTSSTSSLRSLNTDVSISLSFCLAHAVLMFFSPSDPPSLFLFLSFFRFLILRHYCSRVLPLRLCFCHLHFSFDSLSSNSVLTYLGEDKLFLPEFHLLILHSGTSVHLKLELFQQCDSSTQIPRNLVLSLGPLSSHF